MNYRKLGRTGFQVSEIGYGAWGIGGKQWLGGADGESLAALHRSIELGLNFIDTARAYGDGHSERLVGQVAREAGTRIYLATKVPPMNELWPARSGIGIEQVFPLDYILRRAEESLRNLGVETIDLLQLHVWNPEWLLRDEWKQAFQQLKREGKVRFTGISINDHDPASALGIVRSGLIDCVQTIYNVFDQSPERELFPLCRQHDIGVIARVPLDEGALGGRIDEHTVFQPDDFRAWYFRDDRKLQVARHVAPLQAELGDRDLPSTALRFCLSDAAVSTVIPGMRSRRHVEANCALSGQGPLPDDVMAVLRRHAWGKNFYQ